jgi:protoporphyrinogen oxidase
MSMWKKLRFALGLLYSTKIKDPSKLDKIYVREWLTKVFGRQVYENIWDPLLRSKLGDDREKTSAAFIWASINRQYGARSAGSKIEKMGYVHGGYKAIIEASKKKLKEYGVEVYTNSFVSKIKPTQLDNDNSKRRLLRLYVNTNNSIHTFDKILFTIPCPAVLENIGINTEHSYWKQLAQVEYLRVICVFLVLKRSLSPYYVINLLDKELPFTGIIEATNVVSPKEVNNKYLVYLPKYMPAGHPINELKDSEIIELFINKLKKVFPDLNDKDILHKKLFRESYTQPLQKLNFFERKTEFATPIENVYLVNSSMIHNSTLHNNAIVSLAKKATKRILQDLDAKK